MYAPSNTAHATVGHRRLAMTTVAIADVVRVPQRFTARNARCLTARAMDATPMNVPSASAMRVAASDDMASDYSELSLDRPEGATIDGTPGEDAPTATAG